tara:strand:- start:306 stop:452 length:147 start_codon:yes stop_codon:yes gene_type:complete
MVRITPKDAQRMKDAYAKVYAPKEEESDTQASAETPTEEPQTEEETND